MSASQNRLAHSSHSTRERIVEACKKLAAELCGHLGGEEKAGRAIRRCLEDKGVKGPQTDRGWYTKLKDMLPSVRYETTELEQIKTCLEGLHAPYNDGKPETPETNQRTSSAAGSNTRRGTSSSKLRLVVPELAETILPHFFQFVYHEHLSIEITTERHWGNVGERLENDETDVVVHSFSTVLAHNKAKPDHELLFFPLLSFKGYEVIVGTAHLHAFVKARNSGIEKDQSFKSWKGSQRKRLIESVKVLVEFGTDLEWFASKVAIEYGFQPEELAMRGNLIDTPIQKARQELMNSPKEAFLLPTNTMTVEALRKSHGAIATPLTYKTEHSNYLGFICKKTYFWTHPAEVANLIRCWFLTRTLLIDLLRKGDVTGTPSFVGSSQGWLLGLIRELSGCSELTFEDVKKFYGKDLCVYPGSYKDAVVSFTRDILDDSSLRKNHEEIAQLMLEAMMRDAAYGRPTPSIGQNWTAGFREEFEKATSEVEKHLQEND